MLHLVVHGSKNCKHQQLVSSLLYNNNWNALSGIVAANAARIILENNHEKFGCFFAAEGIKGEKMMDFLLKEQHIKPSHAWTEVKQRVNYEQE